MRRRSAAILHWGPGWHRLLRARSLLLLVVLTGVWGPATSWADAFDDHVQQGQLLVIQQKLAEAAKQFEAAYKLKKQPDVALQLGRVYLKLKRGAAAQHYCALYLAEEFDAPADRKQKASECLEQAKQFVGGKKGASSAPIAPPSAAGQRPTPAVIPPPPALPIHAEIASNTQVSARAADWSPRSEVLEVPKDEPPAPPVTVAPPATITTHREDRQPVYKKWWFWTLVGVGVAGAAAGVTAGVLSSQPPPADPLDLYPPEARIVVSF